jgi:hypothetical protein
MTTRTLAIKRMQHVYSMADKVLVLDSSLRTVGSSVAPEELLLRIIVAPWSTHLWMYHEGALASRIYFQLTDCGDELEKRYYSESSEAAGTVRVQELLRFGSNEESNRALVRAMALDENGQGFLDLQSQAEKSVSVNESVAGMQGVDVGINESDLNNISEEVNEEGFREDKNVDESLNLDDVEALEAAMEASIARIQAMNTEIARLESKTAQAYELAAQKKAEARAWELKTERLKLNNLGGLSDGQISPARLYLDVPTTWLKDAPQRCDKKLADDINTITGSGVSSIYWLRAFDPILLKGVIAYLELRTSFKRLSLNMFTDPVPKSEQIREAISALCSRTTSWLSDEAVCLAIILGMDVGKVQEAQGQNRMKTLVSMWQEVPSELVFCGLKRTQGDGFGWTPQSFLGAGRGSIVPRMMGK